MMGFFVCYNTCNVISITNGVIHVVDKVLLPPSSLVYQRFLVNGQKALL